jgi:hypothetical protein
MCKECVTALIRTVSLLRIESPMRLLRASAVSAHKIYVVPEVGVEPTRF